MSFYNESVIKTMQEKIAYFCNAGLTKEAELLQARLNAFENKPKETHAETQPQIRAENPVAKTVRENLLTKVSAETDRIPELEKQYIIENLGKAQTLKELEPLRISYMERLLKVSRAARSEKASLVIGENEKTSAGPYNNEKILSEALQLIYSQDPLWIEDLKELYFSVIPRS